MYKHRLCVPSLLGTATWLYAETGVLAFCKTLASKQSRRSAAAYASAYPQNNANACAQAAFGPVLARTRPVQGVEAAPMRGMNP